MITFKQSIIVAILILSSSACQTPDTHQEEFEIKIGREEIGETIKQILYPLKYATEATRSDREAVLDAVRKDWRSLQYASEELKGDPEIVLEAVKGREIKRDISPFRKKYLDPELRLEVIGSNGFVYQSTPLKMGHEFELEPIGMCRDPLQYASEELKGNKKSIAFIYQSLTFEKRIKFIGSRYIQLLEDDKHVLRITSLAVEGVSAPVINIEVSEDREGDNFTITFTQLSVTQGQVTIDKNCTVGSVASGILKQLNRQKQEKGENPVEYIHIVLGGKKFEPWDHDKPLAEFLS